MASYFQRQRKIFFAFPVECRLNLSPFINPAITFTTLRISLGSPCLPEHTEHELNLEHFWWPFSLPGTLFPTIPLYLQCYFLYSLCFNVIFPVRSTQTLPLTVKTPQPCLRQLHCLYSAFFLLLQHI